MSHRQRQREALSKRPPFVSAIQTGTGSELAIAHGLGGVPSPVVIVPVGGHNGGGAAGTQFPTLTAGAHTTTQVKHTVSAGATYYVMAWIN